MGITNPISIKGKIPCELRLNILELKIIYLLELLAKTSEILEEESWHSKVSNVKIIT